VKEYCLGFYQDREWVLLIRKERPEWQRGLANGVGGRIEENETPLRAMVREFAEETGVATAEDQWFEFTKLVFDDCVIHCFRAERRPGDDLPSTMTDELVEWFHGVALSEKVIVPNLIWLVPMAMSNTLRYDAVVAGKSELV
jgi:8-oxo-dGTP diphosphatase